MSTIKTIDRIAETLRNSDLAWLLPNLRQDVVVWNSLNDTTFYEKFILSKPGRSAFCPNDFSPSKLALIALGQTNTEGIEPGNIIDSIDFQVVQNAIRSFNDQTVFEVIPQDLTRAGLIALALTDMYRSTNSWNGLLTLLPEKPCQTWLAPFACLFGLIDDPAGLLTALIQPGSGSPRFKLAIHTLLSNPIPPNIQITTLIGLGYGLYGDLLPALDRLSLVRELSEQRPQLAIDFCKRWLEIHPVLSNRMVQNAATNIDQLAEILFQVEIKQIAGEVHGFSDLISAENELTQKLITSLVNQSIILNSKFQADKSVINPAELCKKVIQLADQFQASEQLSVNSAEMALTLSSQGYLDEAVNLLPHDGEPLPNDVRTLYAIAKISFQSGDQPGASKAITRIIELLGDQDAIADVPIFGESFSLINLGKLLLEFQKPTEASKVFGFALHICPNDADLLKLLADCYKSLHLSQQIADAFQVLVSLDPDHLGYRRDYAQALEDIDDWEASLKQRSIIIGSNTSEAQSLPINDMYAYAHCALKAYRPELAQSICDTLLSSNPEDSQALIYAGEAHLQLNETTKGIEFLRQATQVAPHIAEAWLTLADAQKKIFPFETVIDTLKHAIQAAPGSYQIHFALGELYLRNNTPTLALPDLQSALTLSPDDPHILFSYGEAQKLLGHTEDARQALSKAYQLVPSLPGLARMYANVLIDQGEIEQAISPLELLIDSKSVNDPSLYLEYARCVLNLSKLKAHAYPPMKALIALNEVLQINPELAEAKALTAEALAINGENEMAFQAYREALDTPLVEDKAWFERLSYGFGTVASLVGKHEVAIAALQDAGQTNPNNPAIYTALTDAYFSANLPEDAVRTARNVLVIDGDNPDNLAWFTKQVAQFLRNQKADSSNPALALLNELPSEALTCLNRAIELAPTRIDLLLQLGDFHASIGDLEEAKLIFTSIASLDFVTVEDLKSASEYLSGLGDHASAIACLEKSMQLDQESTDKHNPSLYISLAHEYVSNHDDSSAINTLDKAIELIPGNSSIISMKIDILLGLGQSFEALHCIETALPNNIDSKTNIDLLFLASRINRSIGDFSSTVKYTRMAGEAAERQNSSGNKTRLPWQYRAQIAELSRALLQYDQAYQHIKDEIDSGTIDSQDIESLNYIFLQAELALETGEPISSVIQDVKLEPHDPSFSRLMAIKARLMNKAGNQKQAEQLFQLAINKTINPGPATDPATWSAPYIQYLNLISLIEAALDLGFWEQATAYTQKVIELIPGEPLPQLFLARALVLKAENYNLCETLEVITHKPAGNPLSVENSSLCSQYLDQARSVLATYQDDQYQIDHGLTYDQIYRWRARANIVYNLRDEATPDPSEILSRQLTSEDSAALISYLHRQNLIDPGSDSLTRIIKLARNHPRNPAVILYVALALQDNNPDHAIKSLQAVLQQNPFAKNPTIAFCNILLAKLALNLEQISIALEAGEAAIEFWQDEPCWHSLAARICKQNSNLSAATNHLSEAARLAPKNIAYQMDLGKLYFENANEDPRLLGLALKSFENALALDPDDISTLISLATTHYLMNDLEKAESNACNALVLAPNRADIYQLLSEIAIRNNDFQGSYEYANKALLINPKDTLSTVTLVKSLSALGRHGEALGKLNTVIATSPDARWLHLERVIILRKMEGPRAALVELIALTHAYPNEFDVLYALAKSHLEVGEPVNAVSIAQQALNTCTEKTSPNEQANLHLMIGQILRQSSQAGQLDQSIEHFSAAMQLAPNRLEPYLELGLARKERREYQQALQIFERATIIAPDDPRAPFQAGLALKESKDYKSSETMLRKAVSLAPNDLNIRRQLAAVVALNLVHNPRSGRNYAK